MKKLSLRKIYLNELKVDEPEGGPYGKVLFAPQRTDKVDPEENTQEEQELLGHLVQHYKGDPRQLSKHYRKILALVKKGKYENLLAPPPGYVYRFLFDISLRRMASFLGKTVKELREGEMGKFDVSETRKGVLETHRYSLQSWTANPKIGPFVKLVEGESLREDDGALLVRANTQSGGKFFMDPTFASKIKGITQYKNEYEVVSAGPVKIDRAAFYIHGPTGEQHGMYKDLEREAQKITRRLEKFALNYRDENMSVVLQRRFRTGRVTHDDVSNLNDIIADFSFEFYSEAQKLKVEMAKKFGLKPHTLRNPFYFSGMSEKPFMKGEQKTVGVGFAKHKLLEFIPEFLAYKRADHVVKGLFDAFGLGHGG